MSDTEVPVTKGVANAATAVGLGRGARGWTRPARSAPTLHLPVGSQTPLPHDESLSSVVAVGCLAVSLPSQPDGRTASSPTKSHQLCVR